MPIKFKYIKRVSKYGCVFFFLTLLLCSHNSVCQSLRDPVQPQESDRVFIERKRKETKIINEKRFQLFKENLEINKEDKFEIWTYTIEGDPIIYKVKFKGESVLLKENSRKDKYAGLLGRFLIFRKRISVESAKKAKTLQELISIF
jgi:hypothetical protein